VIERRGDLGHDAAGPGSIIPFLAGIGFSVIRRTNWVFS
jgi:hypothetical protein